ncbi:hypothetical protein Tco_0010630 [Tanacetum coccineum]
MLLEGSELMKDEHESQLYDDFEHFRQNKGEIIHEYYVRFVTTVKLDRGLKTSNYDQLYAYLKQHEAHANENKMILERDNQHAIDPLAFVIQWFSPRALQYHNSSLFHKSCIVPPVNPSTTISKRMDGLMDERAFVLFNTRWTDEHVWLMMWKKEPVQDLAQRVQRPFNLINVISFDSNVDEAPMAQIMFMANLIITDPI